MKRFLLIGIILALCLSSFMSSALTVTAYCSVYGKVIDPNWYSGAPYDYEIYLEVVTQYPTDSWAYFSTLPQPEWYNIVNLLVNNVGLEYPQANTTYYTMIVWVYKYNTNTGQLLETKSGSCNGAMTYLSGYYYLTASNEIDITM